MKQIGVLWDEIVNMKGDRPFDKDVWNEEYEAFTEVGRNEKVQFYLSHYTEYEEGKLGEAWFFDGNDWKKVRNIDISGVYDKFKYEEEAIPLKKKKINEEVGILNVPELERICKDKLETSKTFKKVPETRKAQKDNIKEFIEEDGKAVVKPRYDHGGRGIQIVSSIEELESVDPENNVVQRFIDTSHGIPETNYEGAHDLRAYVIDDKIMMGLIRQPGGDKLISNVAQGGSQELFAVEDFDQEAIKTVKNVSKEFEEYFPALFSVDMMYSKDGQPVIVEINSKPGLSYYNDEEMKQKILKLVKELSKRLYRL